MGSHALACTAKIAFCLGAVLLLPPIAFGSVAAAGYPAAAACPTTSVGLDTSATTTFLPVHFGHAWGQVIKAEYTQVLSFTVWRKADPDTILDPMHLYVTEVDSSGRPMVDRIVRDGPALVIPVGEEEGKPIEVRYEFDPPLELPGPGRYWFAVKEGWCDFVFSLHADDTNAYPDGAAWRTSPDLRCEGVGGSVWSYGGEFDLIFSVEFCIPTTSVDPSLQTWGRVKAHYR